MKVEEIAILEKIGINFSDLEIKVKELFKSPVSLSHIRFVVDGPELDGSVVMEFGEDNENHMRN